MSSATLNIKVSPRRMLSIREAANYCGLPARRFSIECEVAPIAMPGGATLYDMNDLDTWIEGLKTGQPNSDEAILERLSS